MPLLPARAAPADGFYHRGIEMSEGWRWWRSLGAMYAETFPWVYHTDHGWLYLAPSDQAAVYAWSPDLGWLWLGLDSYPWLHAQERGWLFFSGPGTGGEARFFSRQLDNPLQRRGGFMLPAINTQIEALPLSRYSRSEEPLAETLLNRPPTESDWSGLEGLLPALDGFDVGGSGAAMAASLGSINADLDRVLELRPLLWDANRSSIYPRTEGGWRALLADLGAATDAGTKGLHQALIGLEQFDARWGDWIQKIYTVADGLDAMDQRLLRQRERLLDGEVAALRQLSERVDSAISDILGGDANAAIITDFDPWRVDSEARQAIVAESERAARAARFLAEHDGRMAVFEAAFTILSGSVDQTGVADHYRYLRAKLDAASEVVNALSDLYWQVETALAAGGPYRFRNGGGSITGLIHTNGIGGFNVVGYLRGGPDYRARLGQIRDAFSELDELLGDLFVFTAPLLRTEHRGRLDADAVLLAGIVNRIDGINELLALPVPADYSEVSSGFSAVGTVNEKGTANYWLQGLRWDSQAAPDLDSLDWSSLSPSLQRSLAASAELATPMYTDPNSAHNLAAIDALRAIRERRHSEAANAEDN